MTGEARPRRTTLLLGTDFRTPPALPFSPSSRLVTGLRRTNELFRTVGMTLVINEVVVGVGLLFTGLAPIGFYCYAMSRLSNGWDSLLWAFLWSSALKIHLAAVVVLMPMLEVVLCAYKAVFVCFLQVCLSVGSDTRRSSFD